MPTLTALIPTWRLGGLDCTLEHLAKQTFMNFEVVLVDALHRWRAPAIAAKLADLPFPVVHVPVDDSIVPMVTHARFRNTGLRVSGGERVVFFADYACPPPSFMEAHSRLGATAIGVPSCRLHHPDPETVLYRENVNDFWRVVEMAVSASRDDAPPGLRRMYWSVFRPEIDPLAAAYDYQKRIGFKPIVLPWPPADVVPANAPPPEDVLVWKSESAPMTLIRDINGWDMDFDGHGAFGDTEFALRLIWAGAHIKAMNIECPIIDAHGIMYGMRNDSTRDNLMRLKALRARGPAAMRCEHGIEPRPCDGYAGWFEWPGDFSPEEGAALQAIIRRAPSGTAHVELGAWCGRSLACASEVVPSGVRIWSIDNHLRGFHGAHGGGKSQAEANRLWLSIANHYGRHVVAVTGDSDVQVSDINVHSLLVDDQHTEEQTTSDIESWLPRMAPKSWILVHDFDYQCEKYRLSEACQILLGAAGYSMTARHGSMAVWSR